MSLRDNVLVASVVSVATTAALVGLAGHAVAPGTGRVVAEVVAAATAFGATALVANRLVVAALDRELTRLGRAIRRGERADLDEELRPVLDALEEAEAAHRLQLTGSEGSARAAWEMLDTSPFAIALIDEDGRISWANVTFRSMLRLRGEPLGRRPIEVVPHAELHEVVEEAAEARTRAERAFTTETQDLFAFASPTSSGHVVLRVEDVTNQREAERARTDFVANVSHELRTPVAAVLGYLDLALSDRERLPMEVVSLLETAERNARRLRDLFEDLLRLHRIEIRRRELPLRLQPLRPILEEATGPVRDKAVIRKQHFELDCPEHLAALVNPEALAAMVGNLVSNASAYTPEGGTVRVRVLPEERGVRVDVSDDGIGIAERHHERIFERFYRVDEARSRKVGGTGLGLAIVKHYALASRCQVELSSQEGKGSTFTLHLPVR